MSPYIDRHWRERLRPGADAAAETAGQLNYQITELILAYQFHQGLCYQTINDIIGALEGAKAEYQRRVVGPYEDAKLLQHGDVYPTIS